MHLYATGVIRGVLVSSHLILAKGELTLGNEYPFSPFVLTRQQIPPSLVEIESALGYQVVKICELEKV